MNFKEDPFLLSRCYVRVNQSFRFLPSSSELLENVLVAASAVIPSTVVRPNVYFPPYLHRVGFSLVFGGAAYVLATGDARNGSGIATGEL